MKFYTLYKEKEGKQYFIKWFNKKKKLNTYRKILEEYKKPNEEFINKKHNINLITSKYEEMEELKGLLVNVPKEIPLERFRLGNLSLEESLADLCKSGKTKLFKFKIDKKDIIYLLIIDELSEGEDKDDSTIYVQIFTLNEKLNEGFYSAKSNDYECYLTETKLCIQMYLNKERYTALRSRDARVP